MVVVCETGGEMKTIIIMKDKKERLAEQRSTITIILSIASAAVLIASFFY